MGDMGHMGQFRDPYEGTPAIDVSAKIMVAAIIILFFVIVFVLALHLYAKWYWSRRAAEGAALPARSRRRRFVFVPSQDPVYMAYQGLEPSVLRSIPVITFNPEEFKDGLECAVCLSELSHGEKARLLPKCNHGFHVECIDMWFHSHSTCPICRNPIAPETAISIPEPFEVHQSALEDNSTNGFSVDGPNFPTNVMFWGNQSQVSTRGSPTEEDEEEEVSSSPSDSSTLATRSDGSLVIEVPRRTIEGFSSVSPSASRISDADLKSPPSASRISDADLKSPMTSRLMSLKRLLSREKRVIPCSPGSVDVELGEGGRGQSSKRSSDSQNCNTLDTIMDIDRAKESNTQDQR